MLDLKHMNIVEPVRVDPDRMVELSVALGDAAAESLILHAMDDLADSMSAIEGAYLSQNWDRLAVDANKLEELAIHVGMSTMARVAGDVQDCLRAKDMVSLTATLCRLRRITDKSTCAVWDMRDVPV